MIINNLWNLRCVRNKTVIADKEIHIWKTKVSENLSNIGYYWHLLSKDEQLHANEFYHIKDRNRYIIARALMRELVANYNSIKTPKDIIFEYTDYGKPYLPKKYIVNDIVSFNIAHSVDTIVYAFSKNTDVGIDIEFINKNFNVSDIVEYCCTEEERSNLLKLFNYSKYDYFYKLWAIKESFIKAIGKGLSYDLKRINVTLDQDKSISLIDMVNKDVMHWEALMFFAYNGYSSAITVRKPIEKVVLFEKMVDRVDNERKQ